MADTETDAARLEPTGAPAPRPRRRVWGYLFAVLLTAVVTFGVTALLVSIFTRRQEQRTPFVRVVEVNEQTTDPAVWGRNWPREYDGYLRTVDVTRTRYGGSEAMPAQKLDRDPWLKRVYSGYAF